MEFGKESIVKIALSANGPDLEAQVDPRFGRAPYFLIVDPETLEYEAVANQPNLQASQGAGIQAAVLVSQHRPAVVLTGNCGPKAFQTLAAAGIKVIVSVEGPVKEAVQNYQAGKFRPAQAANVQGHWQ
jgi:predicted Fe-Mo cluster-binding NifX family protein